MIKLYTTEYISSKNIYGREAIKLSQELGKLDGEINISKTEEDRVCNAKSLLGVLSLGIEKGDKILISTDSKDYNCIFNIIKTIVEPA